jgi:MFS family permease
MRHPYLKMSLSLYVNYFLLGMINVILASNMSFLSEQLNTDSAGISTLISAIGLGKLATLFISGKLSDKIGRKPLVVTASFLYLVFLIGIPLAPTYQVAFVFAVVAGVCNSIMDSGTYPSLIEAFPKNASSATVLLKAFVSMGAILLPVMVAFFMVRDMFYGFVFFIPALIFLINAFSLLTVSFPKHQVSEYDYYLVDYSSLSNKFSIKPKFWKEGIGTILIGFSSVALFMVIQVWLPTYGQEVIGLSKVEAVGLLSFYSIGGFISVLFLALFLNKIIRPITVMIVYPSIAFLSLLILLVFQYPTITMVCSFLLGLSTSGLFQLAVALMAEFFPENKGTSSAFVSAASSIAFIIIPFVTGLLTRNIGITSVFIFDVGVAFVSIVLAINILIRYRKLFNFHTKSNY